MSLNRTGIEWTGLTWNPVTGCYGPRGNRKRPKRCPACYARRIATRFRGTKAFRNGFEPTFHPDRLIDPYRLKKPSKIFTCSMGDMFGSWVPENWTGEILAAMANNPIHTFQVLTKCPENLLKWQKFFSPNLWLGVSVARQEDVKRIFYLRMVEPGIRFVSFEPLLGPIDADLYGIDWIIIGAQTCPTRIPEKGWVQTIIDQARKRGIPIFLKNNLRWPEDIKEFPKKQKGGRLER
jgi:protein gp37